MTQPTDWNGIPPHTGAYWLRSKRYPRRHRLGWWDGCGWTVIHYTGRASYTVSTKGVAADHSEAIPIQEPDDA